jgi:hypothetical protein
MNLLRVAADFTQGNPMASVVPGWHPVCSHYAESPRGRLFPLKRRITMARKYGPKAQEEVHQAMREMKHGKLKSGKSGKKVTNPQQAVAIGLSKARKEGAKVSARKK